MRIDVNEGRVMIQWNDAGQECIVTLQGAMVRVDNEQTLRELYECLDFLFGKPR